MENALESIRVKVLPGCKPPEKNEKGDWVDVFAAESCTYSEGSHFLISLGFACQLPEGYEAYLIMRSSTFGKTGLIQTNAMGIIDNSYCGDGDIWMLPVYAIRGGSILAGQKIAQFRIQKSQKINMEFVDFLENKDRGGFGSTGY